MAPPQFAFWTVGKLVLPWMDRAPEKFNPLRKESKLNLNEDVDYCRLLYPVLYPDLLQGLRGHHICYTIGRVGFDVD